MKRTLLRLLGIGIVIAVAVGGFSYWYGFMRKEKPVEKMKPDFEITADSLFAFFTQDEKAANEKFGGKILLLKSSVIGVSNDLNGSVTITLVDPMMGVTCNIDSVQAVKQKMEIESLAEGKPVTIKGRCDGMLTDVKLSKCMIQK